MHYVSVINKGVYGFRNSNINSVICMRMKLCMNQIFVFIDEEEDDAEGEVEGEVEDDEDDA